MLITISALTLAFGSVVYAQQPVWAQCGGINWSGGKSCLYFSPITTSPVITGPTPPPTTTIGGPSPTITFDPWPTTNIQASGTKFVGGGQPWTAVGANAYWIGLTGLNSTEIDAAFSDMRKAGATVVRTWGFNEVISPNGIYYQSWSNGVPTINTGPTGLENFDLVVNSAWQHNLRLIVSLTNNWADYGGMDVYVKQITGSSNHDLFYTDSRVIAAYKNYIKTFVSRYSSNIMIFAWELANEPRCKGSTGTWSGTCNTTTITNWAKDISAYIKSIDPSHMVAIGDEGFYNQPGNPSYPYQGTEGIDFDANLAIDTIDFGTFHAYPESWGESSNPSSWGVQWINDHAASQKKASKPVLLEEFGVLNNQASVYTAWYNAIISSGLTGDLIWQAGSHLPRGDTPNDGYTIYPDDPVFTLEKSHADALGGNI
ncbi:glycosyl hydrolase 5 (cellulase A) family protein [Abortiporus biennis]